MGTSITFLIITELETIQPVLKIRVHVFSDYFKNVLKITFDVFISDNKLDKMIPFNHKD